MAGNFRKISLFVVELGTALQALSETLTMVLLCNIVISTILSWYCLGCQAANIELANMWLHHEMNPFELSHHFGVESSQQVSPDMYQLIKIDSGFPAPNSTKSKRSVDYIFVLMLYT